MGSKQEIRGTREWAVAEINCSRGCPHGCLYCYARYDQVERKKLVSDEEWSVCRDLKEELEREQPHYDGQVMFPAAHDITEENLGSAIRVIGNLLEAGNRVLIVSKPHLNCVQRICEQFYSQRKNILFRFTITARNPELLSLWEPGAPDYQERLMSLRSCFERGFATSVSVEPMLDREDVVAMIKELLPYVSHSIWLGKMNRIGERVVKGSVSAREIERLEKGQGDTSIQKLCRELQGVEKIFWKESMKKVLGLPLVQEIGLDQ